MASLTNLGEVLALNAANGVAPAVNRYIGLFSAAPGEGGGGTEVSGGSYARPLMAFAGATTDNGPGLTTAANSAEVLFTTATADWGAVTHFAIFDAVTAGNMVWHGPLATARTVLNGDQFRFAAGSVSTSMD